MIILGICADKGLVDLFLQDARRPHAGWNILELDSNLPRYNLVEIIRLYQKQDTVTLAVLDGGDLPPTIVKELVEQSDSAFSYYRQNSDRWFKFLKNRIKPVSTDYRLIEFWFMLGSIYTNLITQGSREVEIRARELEGEPNASV